MTEQRVDQRDWRSRRGGGAALGQLGSELRWLSLRAKLAGQPFFLSCNESYATSNVYGRRVGDRHQGNAAPAPSSTTSVRPVVQPRMPCMRANEGPPMIDRGFAGCPDPLARHSGCSDGHPRLFQETRRTQGGGPAARQAARARGEGAGPQARAGGGRGGPDGGGRGAGQARSQSGLWRVPAPAPAQLAARCSRPRLAVPSPAAAGKRFLQRTRGLGDVLPAVAAGGLHRSGPRGYS